MKSEQIKGFRSKAGNSYRIIAFLSFLLFSVQVLKSQDFRLEFHNTPLSEALISISGHMNVKVAFDARKLASVTISREVKGSSPEEIITDLLAGTGFTFRYKYNRYLIVEIETDEKPRVHYQMMGSIKDDESGEELPFATIILYDENLQVPASEKGSFSIRNIETNPVHLSVSYIGYNHLDTTIFLSEEVTNHDMKLSRQLHQLDTIEVKAHRLEMIDLRNDVDMATTFNIPAMFDLPSGAEADIFRILQMLPGINYSESSQSLSIRGGSGDQNLVLFDGQVLYNLSHYYGIVSAINPNVIKDMQVYKGGFDSRYGERVSGIIDISGKSGSQVKPSVYGDINLLSANLTSELPLGKKVSFVGAARRSWSDLYATSLSPEMNDLAKRPLFTDSSTILNQTQPKLFFCDYNAKLTYKPSNVETFSLILFGGKDYMKNGYSASSKGLLISSSDRSTWNNYGFSANWSRQWNESLYSSIQAGTSGYRNVSDNVTQIEKTRQTRVDPKFLPDSVNMFNTYNLNRLNDVYLTMRNSYKTKHNRQADFGLVVRKNSIQYYRDAEREFVYDNVNQSGWTASAYFLERINTGKFVFKPGLRYSFYNNTGLFYAEPRFSANYSFSENFSARMAAGRYYQFINQVQTEQETGYNKNFWIMSNDRKHPVVKSNHIISGFTFEHGRLLLDCEIYLKSFSGIQENIAVSQFLRNSDFQQYFPQKNNEEPPVQPKEPASRYFTGKGESYGSDIMLRYRESNYTSWLSASFGRSTHNFPEINYGYNIPALTDIPYQFSWTNMISRGKWNIGTITYYASGRPYLDLSGRTDRRGIIRYYRRLPDTFRSDLSFNYSFNVMKGRFKAGMTLMNIFNSQNYLDVNTRKFDFDNNSFSETTLIESQSFSMNMFLHFLF